MLRIPAPIAYACRLVLYLTSGYKSGSSRILRLAVVSLWQKSTIRWHNSAAVCTRPETPRFCKGALVASEEPWEPWFNKSSIRNKVSSWRWYATKNLKYPVVKNSWNQNFIIFFFQIDLEKTREMKYINQFHNFFFYKSIHENLTIFLKNLLTISLWYMYTCNCWKTGVATCTWTITRLSIDLRFMLAAFLRLLLLLLT